FQKLLQKRPQFHFRTIAPPCYSMFVVSTQALFISPLKIFNNEKVINCHFNDGYAQCFGSE
ncbi:MAG: hypothetical protein WBA23_03485, partial [Tunicatimonas sp.]|uniref:hypothetical protein n=1 Tax=Tunicatimonas sp. TaxID=1940096 RepID=UPI003C73255A